MHKADDWHQQAGVFASARDDWATWLLPDYQCDVIPGDNGSQQVEHD